MAEDLTKEERELLESVFAENAGGRLYVHQEEALKQLRGAEKYLAEKYPDTAFRYTLFEPQTRMTERGYLMCTSEDQARFRTVIRASGNTYEYADTLYGHFVKKAYDKELTECLKIFAESVRTDTDFYTPMDRSVGKDTDVKALNDCRPVISRHTSVFAASDFEITDQLLDTLRKKGFFGSYSVYRNESSSEYANFTVFERAYSEGESE